MKGSRHRSSAASLLDSIGHRSGEFDLALGEDLEGLHHLLEHAPGTAEVHHEGGGVGRLEGVADPRDRMVRRDRRLVDQLDGDVLDRQHPRRGVLGGEGVGADLGVGTGQGACSADLPVLGGPIRATWAAPSGRMTVGGPPLRPGLLGGGELLGQVLDAGLDVGPQVLGPLVLGDGAQHLLETVEAFAWIGGVPVGGLGGLVLGGQVCRHVVDPMLPESAAAWRQTR